MTVKKLAIFEIDDKKIDLIKKTVAKDATDDELKLFLYQARRTGLDPLARQIYFVKRAGKAVIQTSIDGLRVIAERSGNYAGQDKPEWEEVNGVIKSCTVTVYRFNKGIRYPAGVGVAYWSEYYPNPPNDFMWRKFGHTMISKCAEAIALRKGFPQDLSGLYTQEEMEQSEPATEIAEVNSEIPKILPTIEEATPPETTPAVTVQSAVKQELPVRPSYLASEKQIQLVAILLKQKGKTDEEIYQKYNITSKKQLTKKQASEIIDWLVKIPNIQQEDNGQM